MLREGGGFESLLYISFLSITTVAKYTLCHNDKEMWNSCNYVLTLYVNMLNHTTSSQQAKRECSTNNEGHCSPLEQWETWGQTPARDLRSKCSFPFPLLEASVLSCIPVSCSPVWSVFPALGESPGWGRCIGAQVGTEQEWKSWAFPLTLKESRWLTRMVTSALEMIKVAHRVVSVYQAVISSGRICNTVKHLNTVAVELRLVEGTENSRVASQECFKHKFNRLQSYKPRRRVSE